MAPRLDVKGHGIAHQVVGVQICTIGIAVLQIRPPKSPQNQKSLIRKFTETFMTHTETHTHTHTPDLFYARVKGRACDPTFDGDKKQRSAPKVCISTSYWLVSVLRGTIVSNGISMNPSVCQPDYWNYFPHSDAPPATPVPASTSSPASASHPPITFSSSSSP